MDIIKELCMLPKKITNMRAIKIQCRMAPWIKPLEAAEMGMLGSISWVICCQCNARCIVQNQLMHRNVDGSCKKFAYMVVLLVAGAAVLESPQHELIAADCGQCLLDAYDWPKLLGHGQLSLKFIWWLPRE